MASPNECDLHKCACDRGFLRLDGLKRHNLSCRRKLIKKIDRSWKHQMNCESCRFLYGSAIKLMREGIHQCPVNLSTSGDKQLKGDKTANKEAVAIALVKMADYFEGKGKCSDLKTVKKLVTKHRRLYKKKTKAPKKHNENYEQLTKVTCCDSNVCNDISM